MTTKEAIQAMLDGKIVNRKSFAEEIYAYEKGAFFNQYGMTIQGFGDNDDWEIYEAPKPKKTVTIEKWLLEGKVLTQKEKYLHIVETSDINRYIKTWADYKKVKLLDTYEVEL